MSMCRPVFTSNGKRLSCRWWSVVILLTLSSSPSLLSPVGLSSNPSANDNASSTTFLSPLSLTLPFFVNGFVMIPQRKRLHIRQEQQQNREEYHQHMVQLSSTSSSSKIGRQKKSSTARALSFGWHLPSSSSSTALPLSFGTASSSPSSMYRRSMTSMMYQNRNQRHRHELFASSMAGTNNDDSVSRNVNSKTSITFTTADETSKKNTTTTTLLPEEIQTVPLSRLVQIPNFTLAETKEDVIELKENQRLVCVGDVHGDIDALRNFLQIAGVIPTPSTKQTTMTTDTSSSLFDGEKVNGNSTTRANGNSTTATTSTSTQDDADVDFIDPDTWIGNNTILVQCGDITDRGNDELECFQLLCKLSQQAQEQDGKVILLYGNHEVLNAAGLFQYATKNPEYETIVGQTIDDKLQTSFWRKQYVFNYPARWATYEPGGILSKNLLCHMKVAVKVGKTICVHAGLTTQHLHDYGGIQGMNQEAQAWFANASLPNVTYNNIGQYDTLLQPWKDAEARQTSYINSLPSCLSGSIGSMSPIWMRNYSSPANVEPYTSRAQQMINDVLDELDCHRMVMGHTVQSQINGALQGKAWRLDVGASRGVANGVPEVLEVILMNGTEVVSVLNKKHGRIAGWERQTTMALDML